MLFGVKANGDLLWYRYVGDGTAGAPAGAGWAPKSGNPIGRGWAGFLSLVCTPKSGPAAGNPASTLYGVHTNGNLLWYRYVGNGTADQSGGTGWAPKSGNPIGRGWQNFKILTAAADVLFGVEQNGDLRWYSYRATAPPTRPAAPDGIPTRATSSPAVGTASNVSSAARTTAAARASRSTPSSRTARCTGPSTWDMGSPIRREPLAGIRIREPDRARLVHADGVDGTAPPATPRPGQRRRVRPRRQVGGHRLLHGLRVSVKMTVCGGMT